jgi:replication-associated recombination protein RarA
LDSPDFGKYGGERILIESDGIAGCGKTSAAFAIAHHLGVDRYNVERIDSRGTGIADLREIEMGMEYFGWGASGRKLYVLDEIQDLNRECLKYLLGMLERLPNHVVIVATTTSTNWADDIDGLYSRWARFRFRKPDAKTVAEHCQRIAETEGLPVPPDFNWLRYVQDLGGNNIRDALDQLPAALRRKAVAA